MSAAASRPTRSLPVVAFTCGDPAGVGPAAVLEAVRSSEVRRACRPVLVGERSAWSRAGWRPGPVALADTALGLTPPVAGRPSADSGRLSFAALRLACRLAARKAVQAVVTAPISKSAWARAGIPFPGHTEFLRAEFSAPDAEMILGAPAQGLWSALVTRHVPIAQVPRWLSASGILSAARALDGALRLLGRRRPKLGLCALNPHAGEGGLLGEEERRLLAPAAKSARRLGFALEDPVAADTAWRLHREGRFDGLVCLYHDQALIALKTAAGLGGINWTAGLPIIRTSPAHGTAFDAAAKKLPVDPGATIQAALLAARLAR